MPNCFQLTRKGDASPSTFQKIDAELCQNLSLPFDDNKYTCGWYDIIGLRIALGHSLDKIVDDMRDGEWIELWRIAAYLNEHYTTDAWYEHGWR